MAAHYENTYTVPTPMQQLITTMLAPSFAAQFHLSFKAGNPTPAGAVYHFQHGVTLTSWGENITITLTPTGPTATQLTIRSECSLPTQVVDWGKNKKNVTQIGSYLTAPPATAAFCHQCGQPLTPNAAFCRHCGTPV